MEKFDFNSLIVAYDEAGKFIYLNYLGPSVSQDFKAAWNKALELIKTFEVDKWLINQKKQSIFPDDQKWLNTEWFPASMTVRPLSAEMPRYVATIQPDNFFAEFTTAKFIKDNSSDVFKLNVFKTEEEAKKWLSGF